MSIGNTVPVTYVKQFGANVYHLSQQNESRLRGLVMFDSFVGEGKFYDRIGTTDVYEKTGRYSDTQWADVEWSRRRLNFRDYRWAHPIDNADKLRHIHSPEGEVSKAARAAFGRKMDEIIVGAALGTSYAGKEGTIPVTLPDGQKIGATNGSEFTKLTLETLRLIRQKFWENEAIASRSETINLVVTGADIMNLLRDPNITSADYNTVRALVNGDIRDFMGFHFTRLETLPQLTAAVNFDVVTGDYNTGAGTLPIGSNRCFAFVKEGIQMAMNEDVTARIDERADKDYINQVYMKIRLDLSVLIFVMLGIELCEFCGMGGAAVRFLACHTYTRGA